MPAARTLRWTAICFAAKTPSRFAAQSNNFTNKKFHPTTQQILPGECNDLMHARRAGRQLVQQPPLTKLTDVAGQPRRILTCAWKARSQSVSGNVRTTREPGHRRNSAIFCSPLNVHACSLTPAAFENSPCPGAMVSIRFLQTGTIGRTKRSTDGQVHRHLQRLYKRAGVLCKIIVGHMCTAQLCTSTLPCGLGGVALTHEQRVCEGKASVTMGAHARRHICSQHQLCPNSSCPTAYSIHATEPRMQTSALCYSLAQAAYGTTSARGC